MLNGVSFSAIKSITVRAKPFLLPGFLMVTLSVTALLYTGGFASAQGDTKTQQREEKKKADEDKKAARRKADAEKKQAEEDRKQKERQEKIIKKYGKFTTPQLLIKVASLSQQVAGGYWGQGIGYLIAKGNWDILRSNCHESGAQHPR